MIVRIVRMSFKQDAVDAFLKNFKDNKQKIRKSVGCSHLELMQDLNDPTVFTTHSHWDNEECLNGYRNTELFKNVWKKTKVLFSDKPIAHTYTIV